MKFMVPDFQQLICILCWLAGWLVNWNNVSCAVFTTDVNRMEKNCFYGTNADIQSVHQHWYWLMLR